MILVCWHVDNGIHHYLLGTVVHLASQSVEAIVEAGLLRVGTAVIAWQLGHDLLGIEVGGFCDGGDVGVLAFHEFHRLVVPLAEHADEYIILCRVLDLLIQNYGLFSSQTG